MRKSTFTFLCIILLGTLSMTAPVLAVPVQWTVNGHYYERVDTPGPLTWYEARDGAAALTFMGQPGYLATVTSEAEQQALFALLGGIDAISHHYLGGFQAPEGSEPAGGWQWVTGEPWLYTNWGSTGEPNDSYQLSPNGEDGLQMHFGLVGENPNAGHWNDYPLDARFECCGFVSGYIVEFEAPAPVPEPSTLLLLSSGLAGIGGIVWRRHRRQ